MARLPLRSARRTGRIAASLNRMRGIGYHPRHIAAKSDDDASMAAAEGKP
jgi:hypothetical protein